MNDDDGNFAVLGRIDSNNANIIYLYHLATNQHRSLRCYSSTISSFHLFIL